MNEEPEKKGVRRDRFMRVAEKRTRQVIRYVRLLGNCGNRAAYDYSQADVEKIFQAIEHEMSRARARFKTGEKGAEFTLN